jgi:hypothetical protein
MAGALVTWAPQWATGRITGTYTTWDPSDPEQKITASCNVCGATFQRTCSTGAGMSWITMFAKTHRQLHPW